MDLINYCSSALLCWAGARTILASTIWPSSFADYGIDFDGGNGVDTIDYSTSFDGVNVDVHEGSGVVGTGGNAEGTTLTNV